MKGEISLTSTLIGTILFIVLVVTMGAAYSRVQTAYSVTSTADFSKFEKQINETDVLTQSLLNQTKQQNPSFNPQSIFSSANLIIFQTATIISSFPNIMGALLDNIRAILSQWWIIPEWIFISISVVIVIFFVMKILGLFFGKQAEV